MIITITELRRLHFLHSVLPPESFVQIRMTTQSPDEDHHTSVTTGFVLLGLPCENLSLFCAASTALPGQAQSLPTALPVETLKGEYPS